MPLTHKRFSEICEVILSVGACSCPMEGANSHQKQIMTSQLGSLHHRRVNSDMKVRLNLQKLRKIKGTRYASE